MMDHFPLSGAVVFFLYRSLFIISIMTLLSGESLNSFLKTTLKKNHFFFPSMIQFLARDVTAEMGRMPALILLF